MQQFKQYINGELSAGSEYFNSVTRLLHPDNRLCKNLQTDKCGQGFLMKRNQAWIESARKALFALKVG